MNWQVWAAAACIIICIALSAIYLIQPKQDTTPWVAMSNSDNNAALVHTLEDGSVIYLAGNSSLKYPQHFPSDKRETQLNGTAFFDISHMNGRPFFINTPSAQIEVLGTAFTIQQGGKVPFLLSVTRGRVRVKETKKNESIIVDTGNTLIIDSKGMHLQSTYDEEQITHFRHCIRFKDETVENILNVINDQIEGQRICTTPGNSKRRLTVSFCGDSPKMMALLISTALGLHYSYNDRILMIQ
jgi:ferric-dicitrate binding protein FerR (iron transport regulator)